MLSLILSFFTIVLLLVSLFLILLILMQRASSNAGLGSAFGGGITESAFGAQTSNVLNRTTVVCTLIFFVLGFGLYLIHLSRSSNDPATTLPRLEELTVDELPARELTELPIEPIEPSTLEAEQPPPLAPLSPPLDATAQPALPSSQTPDASSEEKTKPINDKTSSAQQPQSKAMMAIWNSGYLCYNNYA